MGRHFGGGGRSSKDPAALEEELRESFASIDKDGSMTIDAAELREVLKAMGHRASRAEVQELLELMDTDGSGTVDYEEFKAVMLAQAEIEEGDKQREELLGVFQSLDVDGGGSLSAEELQRGLRILGVKLSLEEVEILIEEIDMDGDSEITFDEFATYVLNWEDEDERRRGGRR